jgi:hypothetical protein
MPARRQRNPQALMAKAAELAFATPQVVAHRVTRMAMAGTSPSPRDSEEFHRMGQEKAEAFSESWNAMAKQAMVANQALTVSWLHSMWSPPTASAVAVQLHNAALGVIGKGMDPVHRRAVANAKRLSRTKLR